MQTKKNLLWSENLTNQKREQKKPRVQKHKKIIQKHYTINKHKNHTSYHQVSLLPNSNSAKESKPSLKNVASPKIPMHQKLDHVSSSPKRREIKPPLALPKNSPESNLSTVAPRRVLCSSFILSRWFRRITSPFFSSNCVSNRWILSSALPCLSWACLWDMVWLKITSQVWQPQRNGDDKNDKHSNERKTLLYILLLKTKKKKCLQLQQSLYMLFFGVHVFASLECNILGRERTEKNRSSYLANISLGAVKERK